jgi:WD40 repeat protein
MNISEFSRYVLGSCVAAAMLAACGELQPPIGAPGAMTQTSAVAAQAERGTSWMLPEAAEGDLLYVSSKRRAEVDVLSYPQGKSVGELPISQGTITGLCSDPTGNVWVATSVEGQITMYKYAHGGTSPIATLNVPGDVNQDCAVDPSSGDLAVAHDAYFVSVFPNASGSPETFNDEPIGTIFSLVYDEHSNLLIYGSGFTFSSEEVGLLSSGGTSFTNFEFNERAKPLTFALWKGNYLLLSGIHKAKGTSSPETMWKVSVEASGLKVAGTTILDSRGDDGFGQYACLVGSALLQSDRNGRFVNLYDYVTGGKPKRTIGNVGGGVPTAVAISVAGGLHPSNFVPRSTSNRRSQIEEQSR